MKRLMMLVLGAFVITGLATQHVVAAETKPKERTTKKKAIKKRTASKKQDRKTVATCHDACSKHAKHKIWQLDAGRDGFVESAQKALNEIKICQKKCCR